MAEDGTRKVSIGSFPTSGDGALVGVNCTVFYADGRPSNISIRSACVMAVRIGTNGKPVLDLSGADESKKGVEPESVFSTWHAAGTSIMEPKP